MTITMQSEGVCRRRIAYQRSHTLSALPTRLVQEVDSEQDDYEAPVTETSQLLQNNSPVHQSGSTSDLDTLMASYAEESNAKQQQQQPQQQQQQPTQQRKQALFSRKCASIQINRNGTKLLVDGDGMPAARTGKRLGRTASSTSMLLSRVKDRIREKVFQTSTEWPYAAAIIQERRQRSVDAFEARLARSRRSLDPDDIELEQVPLRELHDKKKRARMKSEPIPALVLTHSDVGRPAENARLAFRRRSISEDTYDRRPCLPKVKLDQPDNKAGIICSNEDLQAIVAQADPAKCASGKRSPTAKKRSSLEPQLSVESSSSTYSSRSVRSGRTQSIEADLSPAERAELAASSDVSTSHPDQSREGRVASRDERVCRSLSLQSASSICMTQNTSPRGSITTSDRRHSDRSEYHDRSARNSSVRPGEPSAPEETDASQPDQPAAVQEVVFDEFGQTWDVYGAEFDPEVVGDAIQRHLVKLMKEKSEIAERERAASDRHGSQKSRENASFWLRFFCLFNRDQSSNS